MRRIIKLSEPESLILWKSQANENWQPCYSDLQNPQKRELHANLLEEQGSLCCYCGRSIDLGSSHIEHFRPQEIFENLELDYGNLHASCIRETEPGTPLHCGHHKKNWFEESLHISPLEEGCEQRFRYLLSGEIQAATEADIPAKTMIDVLALDIAYLNNRRGEAITRFFDPQFLKSVSDEELTTLISRLRSTPVGEQHSYDHVVARFAEQLVPGV